MAVTGLGVVTPLGIGWGTFWNGLLAGRCATGPVRSFSTERYGVDRGAEVGDFDPADYLRRVPADQVGRAAQLAIAAARLALEDAGLATAALDPDRAGVALGTTSGEPAEIERLDEHWVAERRADTDPRFVERYPCHTIAVNVAAEFDLRGPNAMIPTACAAGNYAIAWASDQLRWGRADIMLAGGADIFSRITYAGFARLGAISPDLCRPFDRDRKGMIPGEGAGVLVLEPLESARRRGARIYAEVAGYGLSCDAHHMTGAHPQGDGAVRAMALALTAAGARPEEVDYISAHGTGTPTNDQVEAIAIARLFGDDAPPVSSIKSMIGHTMGAASALEAVACALAVNRGILPPTANFETPDDGCRLDFVPNVARAKRVRLAMNNAYAFGGNNASVLLREVES